MWARSHGSPVQEEECNTKKKKACENVLFIDFLVASTVRAGAMITKLHEHWIHLEENSIEYKSNSGVLKCVR